MEAKMVGLKKVSQCWWFDSHNSAKRSPWLQSTLTELENKIKGILNLIEGDADSFAQRAEMYYRKRPELVNMIEDFYRSYRYVAEQFELLRSEVGTRRMTLFKTDSLNQSISQKTWDSTEVDDYPESEVSEVDNPEPEEGDQMENEEFEDIRRNLEAKSTEQPLIFYSSVTAEAEIDGKINLSSKRISYSFGSKQMENNDHDFEHQYEIKLMELPFRNENDKSINGGLVVCSRNTRSLSMPPSDLLDSKECEKTCHYEGNETIFEGELEDHKSEDLETKELFEKIVDNMAKLTNEVESLKMEKETLMAELDRKDEEKRHVIRELSLTVEIMKEENTILKKFIKDSKKSGSIFEFKKLKEAFSGTRSLFGFTSRFQASLVAL
ncbi:protein NETWORKED 3C [Dendrobium catenatum]|nr:protein NETWORKED 3C [Dendrobium catenatum]XP_028557018.1 protein NETWORKED 3C [Dendrobium catenatum]